jgi:hypothetical protein
MLDSGLRWAVMVVEYGKKPHIPTIFNHQKAGNESVVSILVIYNNIIYINNIHSQAKPKTRISQKVAHLTENLPSHPA